MDNIQLPYSAEAEAAVLGGLMIEPERLGEVSDLKAADFYSDFHKRVFLAMKWCEREGKPIDLLTLTQTPGFKDEIVEVSQLMDGIPKLSNIRHYADIVKRDSLLRAQLKTANEIIKYIGTGGKDISHAAGLGEGLTDLQIGPESNSESLAMVLSGLEDSMDKARSGELGDTAWGTGIEALDRLFKFRRQKLYILAGRPSMGKTALALNIADHLCDAYGLSGLIFEQEMSNPELGRRKVATKARIPYHRLRDVSPTFDLTDEEKERFRRAKERLSNYKLELTDAPGQSIDDVEAAIRRQAAKGNKIDFVIFDYIQIARLHGQNLVQATNHFTKRAKEIARKYDLAFIALSQLSRPGKEAYDDEGVPRMPRLDDLRDSGGLEQDADAVGFIHRPEFYLRQQNRDYSKVQGQALYSQAKNREEDVDTVMLGFHGDLMAFSDPWWNDIAQDEGAYMTHEEINGTEC